jgi:hydroxymethylpyrimidine/phosphomethylpyrimidine kinase
MIKNILSIAGSDSCGGAGIQADIKTATALKTYIATAITCVTSQDSKKVYDISYLSSDFIRSQIEAVLNDIKINAVKTGMLGNSEITKLVAKVLKANLKTKSKNIPLIVDPVMIATSGDSLLKKDAITTVKKYLIPLAFLITPNIVEAELLSDIKIKKISDMELAAKKILELGAENVLIKGSHFNKNNKKIYHLLMNKNGKKTIFSNRRLPVGEVHGTGCTLSAAIASFIAKGYDLENAVKKSNHFVYNAIKNGKKIGQGSLLLNHFYR